MTAITLNTKPRTASRCRMPERTDACTLDAMGAASHVEVIKRFCKLILTIALLSGAAAGIVALKGVIWMSHFNH